MKIRDFRLSLIALLILILTVLPLFPLAGCTSAAEIETYVQKAWYISMRGRMFNNEALNAINAMSEDELSTLGSEKARYSSYRFDRLLQDLMSLESPKECYIFRDYMKDYLTFSSKRWGESYLYYSLSVDYESHWSQVQSYRSDADRALALAYGEGQRLGKKYNFDPTMVVVTGTANGPPQKN